MVVFLCYASEDKPAVRELYRLLAAHEFKPWLDAEDILAGQDWKQEIRDVVRTCDVVVVCISSRSVNKEGSFVQEEIKLALRVAKRMTSRTIFVIPLRFEEVDIPAELSRWQCVDFFKEDGFERLTKSLKTKAEELGVDDRDDWFIPDPG